MAHFLCHLGAHILEPFCSISILPKTLFVCYTVNRNIFIKFIADRIFRDYISNFYNHSIPSNSANPAVISISNSCRSAMISAVDGYSTGTYSTFLYLLMERS